MSEYGQNSAEHALPSGRLNGWKDIALQLGKSVRTVQRWEKELGLPVHRIHTSRGEIVWALANEIDEWLARTAGVREAHAEPNGVENGLAGDETGIDAATSAKINGQVPHAAVTEPTSRRRWLITLAALAVVAVVGSLLVGIFIGKRERGGPSVARRGQPVGFRVEKDKLIALDANSQILWVHTFPFTLSEGFYNGSLGRPVSDLVQIGDLDADGTNEVAFIARFIQSPEADLYVFNADGAVRFAHRPGHAVRFGGQDNSPPFFSTNVLVTTGADGKKTLWLAAHHNTWFPAVVEKLSPDGKLLDEYWSNGHINSLAEATWNGRKVILVAAMYNDQKRTSLAVLDYEKPDGAAPALDPNYRCENCPAGEPLLFYVFPRMEISRVLDARPQVTTLRVTPHGDILVGIEHAGAVLPRDSTVSYGSVFYTFDSQLSLKSAEAADSYHQLHGKLELLGKLKHAYGARGDAELLPVLKWEENKLVPIPLHRPAPTSLARFAGAPS